MRSTFFFLKIFLERQKKEKKIVPNKSTKSVLPGNSSGKTGRPCYFVFL